MVAQINQRLNDDFQTLWKKNPSQSEDPTLKAILSDHKITIAEYKELKTKYLGENPTSEQIEAFNTQLADILDGQQDGNVTLSDLAETFQQFEAITTAYATHTTEANQLDFGVQLAPKPVEGSDTPQGGYASADLVDSLAAKLQTSTPEQKERLLTPLATSISKQNDPHKAAKLYALILTQGTPEQIQTATEQLKAKWGSQPEALQQIIQSPGLTQLGSDLDAIAAQALANQGQPSVADPQQPQAPEKLSGLDITLEEFKLKSTSEQFDILMSADDQILETLLRALTRQQRSDIKEEAYKIVLAYQAQQTSQERSATPGSPSSTSVQGVDSTASTQPQQPVYTESQKSRAALIIELIDKIDREEWKTASLESLLNDPSYTGQFEELLAYAKEQLYDGRSVENLLEPIDAESIQSGSIEVNGKDYNTRIYLEAVNQAYLDFQKEQQAKLQDMQTIRQTLVKQVGHVESPPSEPDNTIQYTTDLSTVLGREPTDREKAVLEYTNAYAKSHTLQDQQGYEALLVQNLKTLYGVQIGQFAAYLDKADRTKGGAGGKLAGIENDAAQLALKSLVAMDSLDDFKGAMQNKAGGFKVQDFLQEHYNKALEAYRQTDDPKERAEKAYTAMKGAGTDEVALVNAFLGNTYEQNLIVAEAFETYAKAQNYEGDAAKLQTWVKGELATISGGEVSDSWQRKFDDAFEQGQLQDPSAYADWVSKLGDTVTGFVQEHPILSTIALGGLGAVTAGTAGALVGLGAGALIVSQSQTEQSQPVAQELKGKAESLKTNDQQLTDSIHLLERNATHYTEAAAKLEQLAKTADTDTPVGKKALEMAAKFRSSAQLLSEAHSQATQAQRDYQAFGQMMTRDSTTLDQAAQQATAATESMDRALEAVRATLTKVSEASEAMSATAGFAATITDQQAASGKALDASFQQAGIPPRSKE